MSTYRRVPVTAPPAWLKDEDVQRAIIDQPVAMGSFDVSPSSTQCTFFDRLEAETVAARIDPVRSPISPETQCLVYYYATRPSRFAVDVCLWALYVRNVHFTELSPLAVYRALVAVAPRALRLWDRVCYAFESILTTPSRSLPSSSS